MRCFMIQDRYLTKNFRLHELLHSDTAERHPIINERQYNPPPEVVESLSYLCEKTLQPIRDRLKFPITISSGYRCESLAPLVGSTGKSQHTYGQAADCSLSHSFFADPPEALGWVHDRVKAITGREIRQDVNTNFYLFAFVVLKLEELDVDQVIHEYGTHRGAPGWVHVSASTARNSREILLIGYYDDRRVRTVQRLSVHSALALGV